MLISSRIMAAQAAFAPITDFYFNSRYADRRLEPGICDFTFGNPHEMPLSGLVSTLREQSLPRDKNWFAYKTSEEAPRAFVARSLGAELDLPFEPEDIALTTGAFAAIMVAIRLVLDAGDEAIICEPAWFCYEPMLLAADVIPRKVSLTRATFDLDLDAIEAAIQPRTRMVIVNTPHNPTGRIYGHDTLTRLAALLNKASERIGRRIILLSDEPYRRLRFDQRGFTSPASVYPWTLIAYSYGKVLLAPGQRLGYLAISPLMPTSDRRALREGMFSAQMSLGWCFPNAVMQYALPDLERLSIDQQALDRRRDLLSNSLLEAGYEILAPEGTFYLWGKWPEGKHPDQMWNALADRDVFVMPGRLMNAEQYFRICLTASDEMVARSLPVFSAVTRRA